MSERVTNEMSLVFEEAENEQRCITTLDRTLARRLQRLCARGILASPMKGIFCPSKIWGGLNALERITRIIRALAYRDPYLVFCGVSAAAIWGLPISWHTLEHIHINSPNRRSNTLDSLIRWHQPLMGTTDMVDGIRVTSLEETTLDCLRTLGFDDGLAVADAFLHRTNQTREQLARLAEEHCRGHKGARQARVTASFANGLAESGGESILRAHLIELGYEIPQLQVEVPDPIDLGRKFRLDMVLRSSTGQLVDLELDGRGKYVDERLTDGADAEEVRQRERLRESHITACGFQVIRFSYADACNLPYLERVLTAFSIPQGNPPLTKAPSSRRRNPAAGKRWRHVRMGALHLRVRVYDRRREHQRARRRSVTTRIAINEKQQLSFQEIR